MATLRSFDPTDVLPARRPAPLSSSDEQARILRAALAQEPDGNPLELEPGFRLEPWERALLHREGRFSRDVKGEALTLLHVRAAEWAVTRALARPGGLDAPTADGAALLLDRALADIGTAGEYASPVRLSELEAIALRLHHLYERVSETSLRLACGRPAGAEPGPWRLASLRDDEFEIEDTPAEVRPLRSALRLADPPEPAEDAFAVESLDGLFGAAAAAPAPPTPCAAPSVPVPATPAPVAPVEVAAARPEPRPVTAPAPAARPAPVPASVPAAAPRSSKGLVVGLAAAASVAIAALAILLLR